MARPYESIPLTLMAWHCGGKPRHEPFSGFRRHVGTGEGMGYLGPGLYFTSDERGARSYCRYTGKKSVLYCVTLDTTGFYDPKWGYDPVNGHPSPLGKTLRDEQARLKDVAGYTDAFKYGRDPVGVIYKALGRNGALERFAELGVRGIFEMLPGGDLELCVYDPAAITPVSDHQPAEEEQEKPVRR